MHATLQLQAQTLFVLCLSLVSCESVKAAGCFEEVTLSIMEGGGVTLSSVLMLDNFMLLHYFQPKFMAYCCSPDAGFERVG